MSVNHHSHHHHHILNRKELLGYAMGDLGGCMTFAVLGSFLTPYYTEVAGLSSGAVAMIYLVLKIWDAINDPMMGAMMDREFAKKYHPGGKFRPWMKRSAPLLLISAFLMWTAPTYVNGAAKVLVAFVTYLLYEASYTMFNIPYGALLSAMSADDGERAKLSSARGIGSEIGKILPAVFFPFIIEATKDTPQLGYTLGISICAVIGFIACMLSCKWTTEKQIVHVTMDIKHANAIKHPELKVVLKENRALIALCLQGLFFCMAHYMEATLGLYMYRDVLGDIRYLSYSLAITTPISFLFLALAPKFCDRYGIEETVLTCQLITVALNIMLFVVMLLYKNAWLYMVLCGIAHGFASTTVMMQWGMIGEAIDYNELITGERHEGSIYGIFNLSRRIGQAIGTSMSVALLSVIGYVPGAVHQTHDAIIGIKVLIDIIPAFLMLLCFISLKHIWNITPAIRRQIEEAKDEEDEAEAA
ncbi:MAG: MFS transporter [Clostridia bacterium]|nr:MFS transporter [Clostridia bacterium]